MVQVEADVASCVPGGLRAQATLKLFQGNLLGDMQGKRHGTYVTCISTLTCIDGALKGTMGI